MNFKFCILDVGGGKFLIGCYDENNYETVFIFQPKWYMMDKIKDLEIKSADEFNEVSIGNRYLL